MKKECNLKRKINEISFRLIENERKIDDLEYSLKKSVRTINDLKEEQNFLRNVLEELVKTHDCQGSNEF